MADPAKKFSFGFTKTTRKPNLAIKPRNETKTEKQLIDCLEGKSIKVKGGEKKVEEKPLIIPLQPSSRKVLVKQENGDAGQSISSESNLKSSLGENVLIKQEKMDDEDQSSQLNTNPAIQIKAEPVEPQAATLEEIAAREILQEAENLQKDNHSNITVPAAEDSDALATAPTEEDYESIPVSAFGVAMLKGMGWKENAGIGKKPKLVASIEATGPKRLSSAAEQAIRAAKTAPNSANIKEEEELKLCKGAFVKIVSGSKKGEYGEVEGFTDECDRVLVKMTIRGETIGVSEVALQVVSKSDFSKNSRVLNSSKYEEVKNKVSQSLDVPERPSPKRSRRSSHSSSGSSSGSERSRSPRRKKDRSPERKPDRKKERSPDRRRERSPDRKRERSPDRKRERSPDRKRERSPDRKRERSPDRKRERSPDRKRERSPDRKRERSPDRKRERSPDRKRERSPDRKRDRSPDKKREKSPDRRRERSPDRKRDRSADRKKERSPDRRRERSPDRKKDRSPDRRKDRSPDRRRERSPDRKKERRDRSASPDRKSKSQRRSSSPRDKNRKNAERKYSKRDSPSPSPVASRRNEEDSKSRSKRRSRSVSPRDVSEKSRRHSSSDDEDTIKKTKSSKKKAKQRSSSESASSSPKKSSTHKKKKKKSHKKKSKRRDSSSPERRSKK